ncbi:MAG TPA: hemerythrin domain-containing protein [Oculatellaceae cyanobacterium]
MDDSPLKTRRLSPVSIKLLEDHAQIRTVSTRLREALQEICHRQSAPNLTKAQDALHSLVQIMSIHALCEERIVFPAMEKYYPLHTLEAEHDELLLKRAAVMSGILNYSFPEDCTDVLYNRYIDFLNMLDRHLEKEENTIFPLLETSLAPEEKSKISDKIDALRAQKTAQSPPPQQKDYAEKPFFSFRLPEWMSSGKSSHSSLLVKKENLKIRAILLAEGASLAEHRSEEQAILLLHSGEAVWESAGESVYLRAGEGLLMGPGLPHTLTAKTDCRFWLLSF